MSTVDNSLPCSYCGLPTPIKTSRRDCDNSDADAIFCCLGCRIASGIVQGGDSAGANRSALTRLGLAIFFTMNVMVFTLVLWTWNVHDLPDDARVNAFREILRYACLLFSAPVLVLLGIPLVEAGLDAWHEGRFTTDVLLLIGVCAAFFYSIASLLLDLPDVYFEVACMILVAVTLGKWLEATAKLKATKTLQSLRQLLPESVRRLDHDGETVIPVEQIQCDDVLRVVAGERIPVDGVIESGNVTVDEQIVTGESIPIWKKFHETVFSGTLNLDGDLLVRATSTPADGTIARLVRAVEQATSSKCRAIRLADQLAAWFVPLIATASLAAFCINIGTGMQHALMASLSVVLIACPCALGIATPLALWVAVNVAARKGVLFRNGDAVIGLAKLRSLALDKTGTVTEGKVRAVSDAILPETDATTVYQIAKKLANSSNHVLSQAVLSYVSDRGDVAAGLSQTHVSDIREAAGKGVTAVGQDAAESRASKDLQRVPTIMLGNSRLADELGFSIPSTLQEQIADNAEQAMVYVGWDSKVRGVFFLRDELRPEATIVLEQLKELGLKLVILTGDHPVRAKLIEKATGIPAIGQLLPEDKVSELSHLARPVAMVGDGINDAIALASADVGIALDSGADVSRDAADVCLMGGTLNHLAWAIRLAQATRKTVIRNLVWAVSYNVIGIGFAVTGNLNPIVAAVAMVGSSLFVLTSSLRLAAVAGQGITDAKDLSLSADESTGIQSETATAKTCLTGASP